MLKHNTLLENKEIPNNPLLKEINFETETISYMNDPNFISMSRLIPKPAAINQEMLYVLSNISPLHNIFSYATTEYHQNPGTRRFKCFKINYKTILYSGQNVQPDAFVRYGALGFNGETALYLSNLLVATAYGFAHQHSIRNNYTFLLDGTNGKDIILFDNFDPENIVIIKNFYDTLPSYDPRKYALDGYYKFSNTHPFNNGDKKFVWNNDPIRIRYNNLYYSSADGDYSKKSISTENDNIVFSVYRDLFGIHDGYYSRSQFALDHYNAVFDDEICLYNFYHLRDQNKITLLSDYPMTIMSLNATRYIHNPITDIEKLHVLIINSIYSIRKILEKTKINRLIESFKYSFMFDKYIPYKFHPYEKYFKNIFDILNRHGLISNLLTTDMPVDRATQIHIIPSLRIGLLGGNYKQKYLKYKEKYLKLKNNIKKQY
jgi:hypothetical protein